MAALLEGSSRAFLAVGACFRRVAGNDDASWRLRFVHRQTGGERLAYPFDVPDPKRGWALRPLIRDSPAFTGATLNSNSRGIRGRAEHDYAKRAGVKRIVVLGDSFTFGEDVSDQETFSAVLEGLLPGSEVLNLGVHGYGHDQMLVYLQEEGVKYHPDVVLLGFLYDDMERNLLSFRDYAKPRFELSDGRLRLTSSPVPPPAEVLSAEPWRSRFFDILVMLQERYRSQTGTSERRMRQLTSAILDALAEAARGAGAQPVFAYLPVYHEIDKPELSKTHRESFFFSYCEKRGIPSVYLRPAFLRRMKAGERFKTYGHWGPLEHATAAEGLRDALLEGGLLPR